MYIITHAQNCYTSTCTVSIFVYLENTGCTSDTGRQEDTCLKHEKVLYTEIRLYLTE